MSLTKKQRAIRFLTPIFLPLVRVYWRVFKPESQGAKVIIEHEGKFLFVRNSYGYKRWNFPGGRIDRSEKPMETAIREAKEEVGVDLSDIRPIGRIVSTLEGKIDTIYIFHAKSTTEEISPDEFEIEEAKWFLKNKIPILGPTAQKIWEKFVGNKEL